MAARYDARVIYGDDSYRGRGRGERNRYVTIDGRRCVVTESRNGDWARYDCHRDDRDRRRVSRDDRDWDWGDDRRSCDWTGTYCRKTEPVDPRIRPGGSARNDVRSNPAAPPRVEPRMRTP
jgi:hypothetical protein